MFEIMIGEDFAAAHNLRNYKGKCEALHGHNYKVWVKVSSSDTDEKGLVVDFSDLRKILKSVISELDHSHLNENTFFREYNPTSEIIAKYIYDKINKEIKTSFPGVKLKEVQVWETDKARAAYKEQ